MRQSEAFVKKGDLWLDKWMCGRDSPALPPDSLRFTLRSLRSLRSFLYLTAGRFPPPARRPPGRAGGAGRQKRKERGRRGRQGEHTSNSNINHHPAINLIRNRSSQDAVNFPACRICVSHLVMNPNQGNVGSGMWKKMRSCARQYRLLERT